MHVASGSIRRLNQCGIRIDQEGPSSWRGYFPCLPFCGSHCSRHTGAGEFRLGSREGLGRRSPAARLVAPRHRHPRPGRSLPSPDVCASALRLHVGLDIGPGSDRSRPPIGPRRCRLHCLPARSWSSLGLDCLAGGRSISAGLTNDLGQRRRRGEGLCRPNLGPCHTLQPGREAPVSGRNHRLSRPRRR